MSYAHTKRRKLIAELKRRNPNDWKRLFRVWANNCRRRIDGPLIGTLEDIVNANH